MCVLNEREKKFVFFLGGVDFGEVFFRLSMILRMEWMCAIHIFHIMAMYS